MNHLIQLLRALFDLIFRFRNRVLRKRMAINQFTRSSDKSDSETSFYVNSVVSATSNKNIFMKFRRIYNYREILEHLNYSQGKLYLEKADHFLKLNKDSYKRFALNDVFGKPRKYMFPKIGYASPTTIRYLATGLEIRDLFAFNKSLKIAEIGAGYGGQFLILNELLDIATYDIFDLPEVNALIEKYLNANDALGKVSFKSVMSDFDLDYDLVISNYAFSELPSELQKIYIEKVLRKSKSGYLIMNSGRTNHTGRSTGKLNFNEIKVDIPNAEILPESPLTGLDNYLLIWGSKAVRK